MTVRHDSRIVLVVAFVVAIASTALAAESTSSRFDELKALVKGGKYAEAESAARVLLAEVEAAKGAESVEAADVIDVLVESLWRGGKTKDPSTKQIAERALTIRENAHGPDHPDVLNSLNGLALVSRLAGDHAGARPLFERVLAIQEKTLGPDHPDVAVTLTTLAYLLYAAGDYAAARPIYERALAINEHAFGPDDVKVAWSLTNVGDTLLRSGDLAAARPMYERALVIHEKSFGPDGPELAKALRKLGNLDVKLGDFASARPLLERALTITEKALGSDHREVANCLNALGILDYNIGDYAAARSLVERSLAIVEKARGPDHPDVAAALSNLASILDDIGEYASARPLYERVLAINEKTLGPDDPNVALGLLNLAVLLGRTGDYAASRRMNERSLAILEKSLGPEHPFVASSLINLAVDLARSGEYAAANQLSERALAIEEKALGPESPDVAMCLTRIGQNLISMGDYTAARPLYERALAIEEKALGPDHSTVAYTLGCMGAMLQNTGDYAAARPMYERAVAIREQALGPDSPLVAEFLNLLARLRAAQGEKAGALDQALDAERIARDHLQLTARSLSERQALRYAAVRNSGLDLALTLAVGGVDPASRRRVLDALVRSRAVVLDEMAARHHAASAATEPQIAPLVVALSSARSRLANLAVRGPGDLEPPTYRKLLDDTQNEKETAERALAGASAIFAVELSHRRLGVDEVAASLPSGTALVAFAEYQKIDLTPKSPTTAPSEHAATAKDVPSYLAFVLRSGEKDPQVVDLGAAETMDGLVAAWRKETSEDGLESAYDKVGGLLRKSVWDRLTPAIGDAGRVFVVPDGSLNLVSLAALPLDDGGYLLERGPLVHYLSAERDLVPSGAFRRGEGLLALGAPNYDATSMYASLRKPEAGTPLPKPKDAPPTLIASAASYRGQHAACGDFASARFGPLPGTGKESREIVQLWEKYGPSRASAPGAAVDLRDAAAGEAALKRAAPGRRVLHLATHGFFLGGECKSALASTRAVAGLTGASSARADDPPPPVSGENPLLLSGLALAGANHRDAAGPDEDDGILTAEEIASLDLSGVEWAVLSACETGVGDVRVGEGVFGLRRAFQIAGARTLIMSLWSVEDEATRSWMNALYSGRLEGHLDTAEAVRHAGLEVLRDRRAQKKSTHPFYWAAFVAAGDWH